jgi:hypothetical protein
VNQDGKASGGVDSWRSISMLRFPNLQCRVQLGRSGTIVCSRHRSGKKDCVATEMDKPRYSRPGAREGHTATLLGGTIYIWGGERVFNWAR